MEKLIKLLNEFENTDNRENEHQVEFRKSKIISKEFGFIRWLCDENKVDRAQKTKEFRIQIELDNGSYGELGGAARLLMLLAISDNPISDLISILK